MRISKLGGFILSLMFILSYSLFYYELLAHKTAWSNNLLILFFVGTLFCFLRKIPAGTKAELLFMEKSTGEYWSDGFCLIPSVFHMFHFVGIYLLWNLKQQYQTWSQETTHNVDISHKYDQSNPNYNVKVETSLLQMEFHRMMNSFFGWLFFGFQNGHPELLYQRIGFRLVLVAIVGALLGTYIAPATQMSPKDSQPMTLYKVPEGHCIDFEPNETLLIEISSQPTSFENIYSRIEVVSNGTVYQSTWDEVISTYLKDNHVTTVLKTTADNRAGKICF